MQLRAENINFGYKQGAYVLKDFNFYIESGEVVGIVAPSGYGKTTLAKLLAGYERPERGKVTLDGKKMGTDDGYYPVQLIFQHPEKAVNPKWKMKKILAEAKITSEALMESMGIETDWLERWPSELSGGELQRFCVIRALSERTKFIIADEMTAMVDTITQAQIWSTVLEFSRVNHIGVVVISHDQSLIKKICHRVVNLEIKE